MRPGEVLSDQQAFQQVLGRLEGDVGTLIHLINEGKSRGYFPNTAPLWALVRIMFPIAESIGDLIHRDLSTSKNLVSVLEKEFESVRTGYLGKANILAELYRHALTHQDELRCLQTGSMECGWVVSFNDKSRHLAVTRKTPSLIIHFDTTAFYDDLVSVCRAAMTKQWNDEVKNRYNSWLTLDLDKKAQDPKCRKQIERVIAEIESL